MTMTIAQAVVEILQQEEVPFVAGLPGSGVMDYLDVLYSARTPRFVLVRHEQVGVHMALGYAEYTGRPAAMLVSRSPGSSNAVIGVQAAWAEGSPLVLISSHVNSEARGLGAFQEIDLESLFRPITKMSVEVRDAQRVPGVLQEAFRVAISGRPGPVHVSIPLNFPSREFEGQLSVPARRVVGRSLPSGAAVAEIVRHLQGARRPAIIAGGGVTKSGAAASVMKLAERIGAAVTNSWEKKAVAETHHLATGNIGRGGSGASAAVLHEADVIVALGFRFSEFATEDYRMRFGPEQTLIQVDIDAAAVGRVFPVQVGVAADAKSTVDMILEELGGDGGAGGDPEWIARISQHREDWARRIADVAWEADPIISPRLVRDLRLALDDDAIISTDSGNFNYWLERYFPATIPGAFLYPAAVGPMGCGMPGAMGVKLAFPDRQVVAVCGDGGFAMTMQDLETCVREHINVVVVVVNNFAYGNIKIRQQTKFGNRLIGSEYGNPDFAALARLFGAHGEAVTKPVEIRPALKRALSAGVPAVLDVHVDPEEICTATIDPWW
ncbi:MAG TPA: thiamine pyrophosphate-binding protein [Candidatus Acidoferrales bacterium]|nr:thiamine pyrophosphate-binding protein [Candidatus Acidoferrales bacterium]